MHEQNEPGIDTEENVISKDNIINQNARYLYLSKFFFCMAAISVVPDLMAFLYYRYLTDKSDWNLGKERILDSILNMLTSLLILIVVYILYRYYRKKMKNINQTDNIKILKICVFSIIVLYLSTIFGSYLMAVDYTFKSGILTTVFLVAFCIFLIGCFTDDKFLYRIAVGYIILMLAISFVNYYIVYRVIFLSSYDCSDREYTIMINIIITICQAAGYLFLGQYLENKDKKNTTAQE